MAALIASLDASLVALTVMTILVVGTVISWHRNGSSDFHLQQVLVDNTTGKISIEKVGYMTALAVGTWGFVALTLKNQMTEGYFTAFLGVFALARTAASGISVWKDKDAGPSISTTSSTTTSTKVAP